MPGTHTPAEALTWRLEYIKAQTFTMEDQAELVSNAGSLPAEYTPTSECMFAYNNGKGKTSGQVRLTGDKVRTAVEQGLTHAVGNNFVRNCLDGTWVDDGVTVFGANAARTAMAGVLMSIQDGGPDFTVTAPE